jgi:hypothetical protein
MATHSIEIINDGEPGDIVSIDSDTRTAKRVSTDEEYQALFNYIGSVENVDFSRLGRARRLIFFEGHDKKLLRKYAEKVGATAFSADLDTTILQSGGFGQWRRVKEVAWTFREVLKLEVDLFALFDRDYRSAEEVEAFLSTMRDQGIKCFVLSRKEIENYALTRDNIARTIDARQKNRLGEERWLSARQIDRLIDAVSNQFIPLQIFAPDVDRDGFDIIVDDGDWERRLQLKSLLVSSGTQSWEIHKRLLRPTRDWASQLGFEHSPFGVGMGGGVVLMQIDDGDPSCPVTYYYSDIFILVVLAERWLVCENKYRNEQALEVIRRMRVGIGRERVSVPLGAFVKLRTPSTLLAAGGFHSPEPQYCWWGNLITALEGNFRVDETPMSQETAARVTTAHAGHAIEELLALVDDKTLRSFQRAQPQPAA